MQIKVELRRKYDVTLFRVSTTTATADIYINIYIHIYIYI